jgi:hypothetical protein
MPNRFGGELMIGFPPTIPVMERIMASFRKELTNIVRPNLEGGKFSPDLVNAIDALLDRAGVPRDEPGALPAKRKPGATGFRKELTDLLRPNLAGGKVTAELVQAIDALLDRAGVPRDGAAPAPTPPTPPAPAAVGAVPTGRLDIAGLRKFLGLPAAGAFDAAAQAALLARLTNHSPTPVTDADIDRAAAALGVSAKAIKAVRKVETKQSPFDADSRPTILYERHVFTRNTVPPGRFTAAHPLISGGPYGPGGYGKISAQYGKLMQACALDPEAALRACSWGGFQVLGENAVPIGYGSTLEMVVMLVASEAAHLESFVRFVRHNKLVEALRACRAGDPSSCIAFVKGYNGKDFASFSYHTKLADALR